jgi:hypothetical protein
MHWAFGTEIQMTLLVASLAATCAAAGLLACELLGSRRVARFAPGWVGAALALIAAVSFALRQPGWLAGGCGSLGGLLLAAWAIHAESARFLIAKCLQPRTIWAALLFLSVLASRFLGASVLHAVGSSPSPVEMDLADVPVLKTQAVTDKGHAIALFHFKMHSSAEEIEQFIEQSEREHAQLIRLLAANPASNCHGWIFTGGQYGVRDTEVSQILVDQGYVEVTQPAEGDLVVYRHADDICHSGLVRLPHKQAPVLVESKWGPLGVYLHAVEAHPFGGECRFYRSQRQGHTLALQSALGGLPTAADAPTNLFVD